MEAKGVRQPLRGNPEEIRVRHENDMDSRRSLRLCIEAETSCMRTIDNVFDSLSSFPLLLLAYRNARKGKRYRQEFLRFDQNLDANILEIQKELRTDTFVFGPYRRKWVYIPKRRMVMALPVRSRIVQWAIYLILNPYFDKRMIEDSYACRVDKGSLRAAKRLRYFMKVAESKKEEYAIVKIDIAKYFYRVSHDRLKEILREHITDSRFLDLLYTIIDCTDEKFGLPVGGEPDLPPEEWLDDVGMPIGNLTSQLFANIYLDRFDQYVKHTLKVRMYIRYMDDVCMLVPKTKAKEILETCRTFLLSDLQLTANRKSVVKPLGRTEFVGYRIDTHDIRIRKKTVERLKNSVRGIARAYFTGDMTEEDYERRISSYRGLLKDTDSENLAERLDRIIMQEKERAMTETIDMLCQILEQAVSLINRQHQMIAMLEAADPLEGEREDLLRKYRSMTQEGIACISMPQRSFQQQA